LLGWKEAILHRGRSTVMDWGKALMWERRSKSGAALRVKQVWALES
jgi:hypothetical protein